MAIFLTDIATMASFVVVVVVVVIIIIIVVGILLPFVIIVTK